MLFWKKPAKIVPAPAPRREGPTLAVKFANASVEEQNPDAFGAVRAAGGLFVFPDRSAATQIRGVWAAVGEV